MNKKAVKTIAVMMVITLLGKVMGLARDMLFGHQYGTSSIEAAAFNVANQLPKNFLDAVFAAVISASFIPIFNEYYEKKGRDEAYGLSYNFLSIVFVISAVVTAIGAIFAPQIVGWYAPAYSADAQTITANLLRIMLPLIVLSGLAYALTGVVQSLGEFNIPAAMSVVSNGLIILYLFFGIGKFGIYGLAVVFILGWIGQLIIQIPFLVKNHFRFKFSINLKDPGLRQIGLLMLPVMVSSWIQPVNVFVNTKIASGLFGGSGEGVNALSYANTLYLVIAGVFVLSIANFIFPRLSRQSTASDSAGFDSTLYDTLHTLFYFLLPMCVGLIILAEPLVRLVYQNGGKFDAASTAITSRALMFYSVGIIGFGAQTILSRGFYALKDGITPLVMSAGAILINLALSLTLVKTMDVGGVALASSVALNLAGAAMIFALARKGKKIFDLKMLADVGKMLAATAVMAAVAWLLKNAVLAAGDGRLILRLAAIALPAVAGLAVYAVATALMKVKEPLLALEKLPFGRGRRG